MTPLEKQILTGVLSLREEICGRDWHVLDNSDRMDRGAWRLEIQDAREGLVPVLGAPWASALDAAGRKRVSRAYAALAAMGLLRQHGDGRTNHLSLTAEGEVLARKLAAVPEATP